MTKEGQPPAQEEIFEAQARLSERFLLSDQIAVPQSCEGASHGRLA